MLSRHVNAIVFLDNIKINSQRSFITVSKSSAKRLAFRVALCIAMMLGVFVAVSSLMTSSANHGDASAVLRGLGRVVIAGPVPLPPFETLDIYGPGCISLQDNFVLGDTVCAQASGAALPFFGFRQRRFQWVMPDGNVVQQTEITTDPQDDTFVIPTVGPMAQVGTWGVRIIKNNGRTVDLATFIVRDPANVACDLSIGKFGQLDVRSGANTSYYISITNRGPDDSANVSFADNVPANMTFVNATQTTGPAFSCSTPPLGGTGTITCTIASLAVGDTATFNLVFEVNSGTSLGTSIENTASVQSSTPELSPADNSSTAFVSVIGASGGSSECIVSCPSSVSVVAGPGQSGAVVTYPSPTTTGSSCGAVSCSQASGTVFAIGTTVVVCAGEVGDTCSFSVTVEDQENPTISCPANISTSENPPGSGFATVNYPAPVASDNSGIVDVSCDHPTGSSFPLGSTTVTCTATDVSNNSASCSFTVDVVGNGCELTCPDDVTVIAATGSCNAVVTYPNPTASTECGTVTSTPASGSTFPIGTTVVNVSTTSGQSCSFNVTVVDEEPPTISACPASIVVNAPSGSCSAVVNPGTPPTGSDTCSSVTVTGTRSDGEPITDLVYPVGTTTITWTATDSSGNATSCEQTITVRDLIPPTVSINVPPAVSTVDADANCQALIPDIRPYVTATDNCTPAAALTISQSPVADTVVGNGPHTITITVIEGDPDGPHNTTTATTTFTVNDVTPPVITLNGPNPITVECHTSFTDPGATAVDACAGTFAATGTGVVNVNVPGSYTRTYNASDPSGNAATPVTRTVNVVDTIAPTITLTGAQIVLWPPNHSYQTVNLTQLVASASDGCDTSLNINNVEISKVTSDEPENGTGDGNTFNDIIIAANCRSVQLRAERDGGGDGRVYTIHFRVRDASGNVKTATAQVTVPKNQSSGGSAIDSGVQYTVNGTCP